MSSPLIPQPPSDAAASETTPLAPSPTPTKSRLPLLLAAFAAIIGLLLLSVMGWLLLRNPAPPTGTISDNAVVIHISHDGFYRVPLADLRSAGLTLDALSADNVELIQQGDPVPFFIEDNSLIFYGLAPTSPYTTARPYILRQGNQGQTMTTAVASTAQSPVSGPISQTLRLEENHYYQGQARSHGPGEIWFWETIQVGAKVEKPLNLTLIDPDQPATLTLGLWGSTYNDQVDLDHDLDILINGQPVGTLRWDGQIFYTGTLTIPPGVWQAGQNTLLLDNSATGATLVDIMHLNWLALTYQSPATAVDDRLWINPMNGERLLDGFSEEPWLFDVANPLSPVRLTDWEMDRGRIPLTLSSDMHLAAIGPNGFLSPAEIRGLRLSPWADTTNQADLLIITTDALAPALIPLQEAREAQGIRTVIVPIAEIYDAFGFGEPGPDSLRAFLQYTHQEWAEPKPQYVLLVGDVSTDFRNYLGQAPANIIPTVLIPVTFSGETVSDTRLADLDGDLLPDVALGRWPVDDVRAVTSLVERTLAYEQGTASAVSIFSADGTEEQFSVFADNLISQNNLPETDVVKLYGQPTAALTTAWNEGAWLVTYNGHGSLDMWGKDEVFTLDAVTGLRPRTSSAPIVLQFTCLTGLFAHSNTISISEAMLTHENGPVLIIAATSLTLPNNQEPFAQSLIRGLQNPANQRMGDALLEAQHQLNVTAAPWLQEIVDTFGLLGDPSALIVRPQNNP